MGVSRGAKLDRTVMLMRYPTRVGVNRVQRLQKWVELYLSHASGSESLASELAGKEIGSVPREWECIAVHAGQEYCHLGCPTRVGMNRTSGNYSRKGYDFSHTRGNGLIPSLIS